MKKFDSRAFVHQLLVYTLGMICFSGSVGVGTVWLRHQISQSANTTRVLEGRLREVERHIAEFNAEIERAQSPAMLEYLNQQLNLGLQRATPAQVMHVGVDPVRNLVAKRNREIFTDSPAAVRLNVALRN